MSVAIQTEKRSLWTRIFSTNHEVIGRQYFFLSLCAVVIGVALSLLMRWNIVWPGASVPLFGEIRPETYLAFMTIHGTLMVFFVLTTAPHSAFGNLLLPAQIGTREMAFPKLNALSFWITAVSLLVLLASLFVSGGASTAGWTQYPPLSAIEAASPGMGAGMDLWLVSIALFCVASVLGSVNFLTTVLKMRAEGMHLMRMPLTVWAWFVTAMLSLLAFSVLIAAAVLLFCDRHYGTSFFLPAGMMVNGVAINRSGGSPLLWQHLFWFFGHPEVYIAILPGMGVTSHVISTFSRKTIFGYRVMVWSMLAIGIMGFLVWGHHMFTSGMNPFYGFAFSALTSAIAVPSSVKLVNWLGTLWGGRIRFTSPMLFSIGFISLFITGGLTGPILAQPALDMYLHDTYFVVAHFHMIMGMAAIFGLFAATYFWFPKLFPGRMMSESLGKWHFWLTFLGAYATFLPMHFLGLAGHPRRYAQIAGSAEYLQELLPLQTWITVAAFVLAAAQLLFFFNLVRSAMQKAQQVGNPWQATTLEWFHNDGKVTVERGPYEFVNDEPDFRPQSVVESQ